MVLYAKFEIPSDGFRIGQAFGRLPNVRVELERVVPTASSVIPFIWVQGADPDDVRRVTRAEGAVEHIEVINVEPDEWALYRVVWNREFRDTVVAIAEADVTLLAGEGTAERWWFEFRATSRRPIADFRSYLRAQGVPVTVVQITELDTDRTWRSRRLTGPQLEALELAHQRGYFREPRGVKLDVLAEEVGISRQAFGGRLRRGIENLVAETVIDVTE